MNSKVAHFSAVLVVIGLSQASAQTDDPWVEQAWERAIAEAEARAAQPPRVFRNGPRWLDGLWFFGGSVNVPVDDDPVKETGGGLTLGGDIPVVEIVPDVWLGPTVRGTIYGARFSPDIQLNQLGNIVNGDRTGNSIFGMNLQPGLLCRIGVGNNLNIVLMGSGLFGFQSAGNTLAVFDPNKIQFPVTQFETNSNTSGVSAGGGAEFRLPGGQVVRTFVTFNRYQTSLFTGRNRQENSLSTTVELLLRTSRRR